VILLIHGRAYSSIWEWVRANCRLIDVAFDHAPSLGLWKNQGLQGWSLLSTSIIIVVKKRLATEFAPLQPRDLGILRSLGACSGGADVL
jgi:hypothetical protein